MKTKVVMLMICGILTKVEYVTYQDGTEVMRIFDNPQTIVPSDIIWVKTNKPLAPDQIIEHREVQMYNHYFNVKH